MNGNLNFNKSNQVWVIECKQASKEVSSMPIIQGIFVAMGKWLSVLIMH